MFDNYEKYWVKIWEDKLKKQIADLQKRLVAEEQSMNNVLAAISKIDSRLLAVESAKPAAPVAAEKAAAKGKK